VARRLSREGYGKSGIRGDTRITATTIRGWRKAAREGEPNDLMRIEFERWLDKDGPLQETMQMFAPIFPALLYLARHDAFHIETVKILPSLTVLEVASILPSPTSPKR
jgi:hypothetical protein